MNTTHPAPQFGTRPQLDGRNILTTITPCPECAAEQLATIGGTAPRLLALPGETVAFCIATHGYVNTPAEVLTDGRWMPVTEVTVGMHVSTGERIERIKATAKQIHVVTVSPKFGEIVERKAKDQQMFVYPTNPRPRRSLGPCRARRGSSPGGSPASRTSATSRPFAGPRPSTSRSSPGAPPVRTSRYPAPGPGCARAPGPGSGRAWSTRSATTAPRWSRGKT